jgi:predicted O-linked N-acetylglucosamine transferase (SPINDLY family)
MQVSTSNPTTTEPLPADIVQSLASSPATGLPEQIDFYEAAITADETEPANYWHLGVEYLLAGREDDAQAAWFVPMASADSTEIDLLTDNLLAVLEQQATYQTQLPALDRALLIRQHIWTLAPNDIENVLKLVVITGSMGDLTSELLLEWQVKELLATAPVGNIDGDLLEQAILALMKVRSNVGLEAIESCLQLSSSNRLHLIDIMNRSAFQIFHLEGAEEFAIELGKISQRIDPDNLSVLIILAGLYSGSGLHDLARITAERYCQLAPGIPERLFGSYLLQRSCFSAGDCFGALAMIADYRELLVEMIRISPKNLTQTQRQASLVSSFFLSYTEDSPQTNKPLQNQLAAIYQQNIKPAVCEAEFGELLLKKKVGCLRIGYVGSTFKAHSVGWLSRWLFQHHDREYFQIFIYCINVSKQDEFTDQWFRKQADISYHFDGHPDEAVAQIRADEIDILIDLDSLTFDLTCVVMANKPAPVQISWLGWDSTGIPAVDYFIADPYVLPANAQDYYQEKIWRLPHTYLAIDGFEVGVPTLRREDLNIPADAVVYLCSQTGYKRHPDNIRCQMKILKAVPNSYFLIKGKADANTIQNLFGKMANEEGISLDRLRFLERDRDESTHRANLAIADIVLDTFPYNGATTTLETLWMGIPLVTQVGEQFSARNSYTFMLNAGIEEGIAWNEQEYINWGIKLGLDRNLRWQIKGKLHAARTTAPVWDAKQFTLDLEQAYREMWEKYQAQQQDADIIDLYENN